MERKPLRRQEEIKESNIFTIFPLQLRRLDLLENEKTVYLLPKRHLSRVKSCQIHQVWASKNISPSIPEGENLPPRVQISAACQDKAPKLSETPIQSTKPLIGVAEFK